MVIVTSMIETSLNTLFAYWLNYTKQLELFRLIKRIVAMFVQYRLLSLSLIQFLPDWTFYILNRNLQNVYVLV